MATTTPPRDIKSPTSNNTFTVTFRVKLETAFGEQVVVVGNCPELGSWNSASGHRLTTNNEVFPYWYSPREVKLPRDKLLEYKYAVLDSDGVLLRWKGGLEEGNCVLQPGQSHIDICDQSQSVSDDLTPENAVFSPDVSWSKLSDMVKCDYSVSDVEPSVTRGGTLLPIPVQSQASAEGHWGGVRSPAPESSICELMADAEDDMKGANIWIVAYELPVGIRPDPTQPKGFAVTPRHSLILPGLHALRHQIDPYQRRRVRFVGGVSGLDLNHDQNMELTKELDEEHDCMPVFLSTNLANDMNYFVTNILWPFYHQEMPESTTWTQGTNLWGAFQAVNKEFALQLLFNMDPEDVVWLQDYQLLLVPQHVVRKMPLANIGIFFHVPFPSSEVFRCFPYREEILRGCLCADMVGFHMFEYSRHFLVACKRLLGLDHHFRLGGHLCVEVHGRDLAVRTGHACLEFSNLRKAIQDDPEVGQAVCDLEEKYSDFYVFTAIDRLARISGVEMKLMAYKAFLENFRDNKIVLLQYLYPAALGPDEQQEKLVKSLFEKAEEINRAYSPSVQANPTLKEVPEDEKRVVLKLQPVPHVLKHALFTIADCLIDTALRDGLNLNPYEYLCCRRQMASIIVSEFTGSSGTLASAVRVNPWNISSIVKAMERVYGQTLDQIRDRLSRDRLYLRNNTMVNWAHEFLLDLKRTRKSDNVMYMQLGFGSNTSILSLNKNFSHLEADAVVYAYRRSSHRIFFFDHEGTLAADRRRISAAPGCEALTAQGTPPSPLVKSAIQRILLDTSGTNTVVILSGRNRETLDSWFGDIKGVCLAAEHGFNMRLRTGEWACMTDKTDFAWKKLVNALMHQYVKRTHGSFIENKGSAITFQYRDADPDFGTWQARELTSYLREFLVDQPVEVVTGKGYVEVRLQGIDKGTACTSVLTMHAEQAVEPPVDFVLCIGDDRSDEDMYAAVHKFFESDLSQRRRSIEEEPSSVTSALLGSRLWREDRQTITPPPGRTTQGFAGVSGDSTGKRSSVFPFASGAWQTVNDLEKMDSGSGQLLQLGFSAGQTKFPPGPPYLFTVTVGRKPSNAMHFLNDPDEVSDILTALQRPAGSGTPIAPTPDSSQMAFQYRQQMRDKSETKAAKLAIR